jgi:hypothetical protein
MCHPTLAKSSFSPSSHVCVTSSGVCHSCLMVGQDAVTGSTLLESFVVLAVALYQLAHGSFPGPPRPVGAPVAGRASILGPQPSLRRLQLSVIPCQSAAYTAAAPALSVVEADILMLGLQDV